MDAGVCDVKPRVFVAGAPRSGTSVTCQALHALGLDFGPGLARADHHNRGGYFENVSMRRVCREWLRQLGADPMGQWPLPDRAWRPTGTEVSVFRADVLRALGEVRAHKDAKTLPLWPLFDAAFPDATWIVVRRDPTEIAMSCVRTRFMQRYRTLSEWGAWADEMHLRLDDLAGETDAVQVWPDMEGPDWLRTAAEALGMAWDGDAVASVLKPEWWSGVPC